MPYEAIGQDEDNREYVYVCQNGKLSKRFVETGAEMERSVEVKSGLAAGEFVVMQTQQKLYDGMVVRMEIG